MMVCTQFVPFNASITEVDFFTLNWEKERKNTNTLKSVKEEVILTILPFTTVHKTVWIFTSLVERVPNQEADAVM